MNIEERFLKYVSFDTQSDEYSNTTPSTLKQLELGKELVKEMLEIGISDAHLDEYGIVYGTIKGNGGQGDVIGFIAHMDTSPDASGTNIKPRKITNYDGSIITINEKLGLTLDPDKFNILNKMIGHDLITTDGTTLLGADDKAGVAIIMDLANYLYEHPEVKHNDINQRVSSRSGGAFVAFSDWILKNKGAIYGAVVCNDFSVRHIRSLNHNGQMMMKKAKYVQSDTSDTFINVKNDLDNCKYVLYTGTPCQIAGLKKYLLTLNVDTKKLYTCDLICHGVPSPLVWKDYVNYVQSKANKTISHIEFRDKEFGWDSHCESFTFIGTEKKYVSKDYTNLFYKHVMFRPSCYNCKFANTNRVGDITLGDFWGIEKNNEAFNDNKGVSLVLCNTEKGKKLFDMTKRDLKYFSCDINNCLQPTLQRPSTPSNKLNDFWKDYQTKNFKYILNKYSTPDSLIPKIKFYIKKIMYKFGLRNHP